MDPLDNNKCKGYGFVDFESAECAEIAVRELNKKHIPAQMAKQQEQDPTNIYFSNLPYECNENDLEDILSIFGIVISTRILRDTLDGKSKGVGFARMDSSIVCDSVIEHFNNNRFEIAVKELIDQDGLNLDMTHYKFPSALLICKLADGGTKKRPKNFVKPFFGGMHWSELPSDVGLFSAAPPPGIVTGGSMGYGGGHGVQNGYHDPSGFAGAAGGYAYF